MKEVLKISICSDLSTRCPSVVKVYLVFESVVFHVLTRDPKLDTHTYTYLAWLWVHCKGPFKSSMRIFPPKYVYIILDKLKQIFGEHT